MDDTQTKPQQRSVVSRPNTDARYIKLIQERGLS